MIFKQLDPFLWYKFVGKLVIFIVVINDLWIIDDFLVF